MNSNWQHKIQQHEATPPQSAWENIANLLDAEATESFGFAERLKSAEMAPPSSAEKNIFALLDTEEAALFEKRLYNYETPAPENSWQQIVNKLDNGEAKIISLDTKSRRINPVFFRAAAAIIIVALLSISVWVLNRQGVGNREIAGEKTSPAPVVPVVTNNSTANNIIPAEKPAEQTVASASKSSKQKNVNQTQPLPGPAYVENADVITLAQNPATLKAEKLQNANGQIPEDFTLVNNSAANTYVTIAGPDGQSVRVSSKLAVLVNYLTDNGPETQENIEVIIKESAKWRATFAGWREKMTNNNIAPSLTNFMDIIELSNVLEEKK
jgi:hypothetical protein